MMTTTFPDTESYQNNHILQYKMQNIQRVTLHTSKTYFCQCCWWFKKHQFDMACINLDEVNIIMSHYKAKHQIRVKKSRNKMLRDTAYFKLF